MMIAIILWIILTKVVVMVNTDYCLLQTPKIQACLPELSKGSIEQTWKFVKKINKYIEWAPLVIIAEIVLEVMLIAKYL